MLAAVNFKMFKIGILTDNLKSDFHSAELFEQVSDRAEAFIIQAKDIELDISYGLPLIRAGNINMYDLDAIIIRRLDGAVDTDLQFDLLSQLQQSGVLLINSLSSLQFAESKALASYILSLYGLPVVDCLATQNIHKALYFFKQTRNVIAKPLYGNLGEDIYKLDEVEEPKAIIKELIKKDGSVFLQKFIESEGKDIRAFVINDHVAAAIERRATNGWRTNIAQGAVAKKISLSKELRDLSVKASQIAGLSYCGVDLISDKERTYILELNGSAAWQGVKEATGKNISEEIVSATLKKLRHFEKTGQFTSS